MEKRRSGLLPLILLMTCAVGLVLAYGYTKRSSQFGRRSEENVRAENMATRAIQDISQKAQHGQTLTYNEFGVLTHFAESSSMRIRVQALAALFYVKGSDQVKLAADIARRKLTDPEHAVRMYAVTALSRMGAPDARQVAKRMLNDPSVDVRSAAQNVIDFGD